MKSLIDKYVLILANKHNLQEGSKDAVSRTFINCVDAIAPLLS